MAISFPNNPSLNDTFTSGGITFTWNGTNWVSSKNTTVLSDTTPQLGGNLDLNSQDITGTGNINVTGTVTATSFSGTLNSSDLTGALPALDGSALTGAGTTTTAEWTLGADGSNHYTFTGPGVTDGATDPTIYLTRGQTYKFKNRSGGHPFRIQTSFQNTGGTAYNDGITNNAAGNGEDLYWEVRNDTPDTLYYQCTSHTNMSGRINMIGGESKVVGLTSTTATARDAGITTATGSIVYVPDVGLQVYTGNVAGWKTIADTDASLNTVTATGGSVTTIGGYKVHTFTSSGTFVISEGEGNIEYLVIAGGGAGSKAHTTNTCGGGGAGGYRTNVPGQNSGGGGSSEPAMNLGPGTYTVTVGGGGTLNAPPGNTLGTNGSNSVFYNITSTGGGRGGGEPAQGTAGNGGSGGGGGSHNSGNGNYPGGTGTTNQGYRGGNCNGAGPGAGGGGGGGAAQNGTDVAPNSLNGGPGGNGVPSNIDGTNTHRAAGGGGSGWSTNNSGGSGGTGGGGAGGYTDSTGTGNNEHATANTGSGGGGGKQNNNRGNGGSGIVIVRYPA